MKEETVELLPEDREWLYQAEKYIESILREHTGYAEFGRTGEDLAALQKLLDAKIVQPGQTLETQCMGVVLGNILERSTSLEWARVMNESRDRIALHNVETGKTVYPVTLVSRKLGREGEVNLEDLLSELKSSL